MKNGILLLSTFLFLSSIHPAIADRELPSKYVELLPYVQPGPDQGRTGTCLYVGSTGVMELLANKKNKIKNPRPYGAYDLSEAFLISQKELPNAKDKLWIEKPLHRFNWGYGVLAKEWEFDAWRNSRPNRDMWSVRDITNMKKVELPEIETIPLFAEGDRWSFEVLDDSHIEDIKEALVKYRSPVLISYNDNRFWHVISIVGYDDRIEGNCYQIPKDICREDVGSFYVRDSFGVSVEVRDYDWMRLRGNHAVVVKEIE